MLLFFVSFVCVCVCVYVCVLREMAKLHHVIIMTVPRALLLLTDVTCHGWSNHIRAENTNYYTAGSDYPASTMKGRTPKVNDSRQWLQ